MCVGLCPQINLQSGANAGEEVLISQVSCADGLCPGSETTLNNTIKLTFYHTRPVLAYDLYYFADFNAKPRDKVVLITDATKGAGLKPGTKFDLYGIQCNVTPVTATVASGQGLAGSTLTMIRAVQTVVERCDVPLVDAVLAATLNPARQLNRDGELGSLEPGKRLSLGYRLFLIDAASLKAAILSAFLAK